MVIADACCHTLPQLILITMLKDGVACFVERCSGHKTYEFGPNLTFDDLNAHTAGGAFDLAHRALNVDGIEVLHLGFGDLANL